MHVQVKSSMARAYVANSNALLESISKSIHMVKKISQDKRKSITNDLTRWSYDDPVNLLFVLTALLALLSSLEQ